MTTKQETPYVEDNSLVRSNSSLTSLARTPSERFLQQKASLQQQDIIFLRSRLNGLYVTVKGKSTAEGAALVMKSFTGDEEQQFSWQNKCLVSLLSGKAIDISEGLLGLTNKTLVLKNFLGGAVSSQCFEVNEYQQLVSVKYPHMCMDVKQASTAKGTPLILFPIKGPHQQDAANQLFDLIPKNKQSMINLDSCTLVKKMGGYNNAVCLMLNNNKIFFKPLSSQKAILLEAAGSLMTNYISGGLVNLSHRAMYNGKTGIYQEFIVMNEKPFRTPDLKYDKKNYVMDFSSFNSKQIHQLFCHMIADRLISNWDTHNENFAMDDKGNVISYDKEKCFWLFELGGSVLSSIDWKEDYKKLDLHKNLWKSPAIMAKNHNLYFVHGSLCHHILQGTVKIDPNDQIIQDMFKRCESITKEKVRECFGEYALYKYHSQSQAEFLHIIYTRIKNIKKPVYRFFKWPNEPQDVDTEPWILD